MIASGLTIAAKETHPVAKQRTLRAIAGFEAIKGTAALAGIVGVPAECARAYAPR